MSYYVRIPNQEIQRIEKRSKLKMILAYALIRSQIKDDTNTASYPEKDLAAICGVKERTMVTYIQDLQTAGLIRVIDKKQGESQYPYNVYLLEHIEDDFLMIKPELLFDPLLDADQKGLLILLKSHCHAGTNHMDFPTIEEVAKTLQIDHDRLSKMITVLKELKYVRRIGSTLIITNDNVLMFYEKDCFDAAYLIIYRFCLLKNVVPPIKGDKHTFVNNIGRILESFPTPKLLANALIKRFKILPPEVSISYFCEGLCNKHYLKKPKSNLKFTM